MSICRHVSTCEAGAAEPLAEAFVETIGDAVSGNVATKADINRVETTLKADITASEVALKADIAESEVRVQVKIAEVQTEVANVRAELKTDIGLVRAEIGGMEGRLYRQLWLMAVGIVGLTVALVKLIG